MNDFDQIIQATREEFEPSRTDRERVRQRLAARAAGAAIAGSLVAKSSLGATTGVSLLAGHSFGGLAKLFFVSMACTLVGAGAIVGATRLSRKPPADSTRSTPVASVATARLLNPTPALPIGAASPPVSVTATPAAAAPPRKDEDSARRPLASGAISTPAPLPELDRELASLREVRQASASGQRERAEQLLDQLDREHPHGLLLEERSALRATTVCDAGDTPRAKALAGDFSRLYPKSVYAAKVRRACRISAPPAPASGASASFTDEAVPGH